MSLFRDFATRYAQFKVLRQERDAIATKALGNLLAEEVFTPNTANYIEMHFVDDQDESRKVVVTASRCDGKSPHQLRREAEDELKRLQILAGSLVQILTEQFVAHNESDGTACLHIKTYNGYESAPLTLDAETLKVLELQRQRRELALKTARELLK